MVCFPIQYFTLISAMGSENMGVCEDERRLPDLW